MGIGRTLTGRNSGGTKIPDTILRAGRLTASEENGCTAMSGDTTMICRRSRTVTISTTWMRISATTKSTISPASRDMTTCLCTPGSMTRLTMRMYAGICGKMSSRRRQSGIGAKPVASGMWSTGKRSLRIWSRKSISALTAGKSSGENRSGEASTAQMPARARREEKAG